MMNPWYLVLIVPACVLLGAAAAGLAILEIFRDLNE